MVTTPAQDVLTAVQQMHGHALDDLHRAKAAFRGLSTEELKKEHGESGQSRAEIISGYEEGEARWQRALTWVKEKLA